MEKKPFLTEAMAQEIIQDVPDPLPRLRREGHPRERPPPQRGILLEQGLSRSILRSRPRRTPSSCKILKEEGCGVRLLLPDRADAVSESVRLYRQRHHVLLQRYPGWRTLQQAYKLGAYHQPGRLPRMVDFLEQTVGQYPGDDLLPLQSGRHLPAWARAKRASRSWTSPAMPSTA